MSRTRRWMSPTNWIYVLVHLVLMVVGYSLTIRQNPLLVGIGSSLIAAGVTGWVVLVYVLQAQQLSDRVRILTELGLTSAFKGRSVTIKPEYDRRLTRAKENIDVLGFG